MSVWSPGSGAYSSTDDDDLVARGLRAPAFVIVDGASEFEKALTALWDAVPMQHCTVHKHRNLLAHAPERLHDETTADYSDMIYAATPAAIEARRRAFIRKWQLKQLDLAIGDGNHVLGALEFDLQVAALIEEPPCDGPGIPCRGEAESKPAIEVDAVHALHANSHWRGRAVL